jgi:hypothetical protein
LILAVHVVNDAETIVSGVGLQISSGRPSEATGVVDALNERRAEGNNVLRRTAQQLNGDLVRSVGTPGNGVGLASRDDLVESGLEDGVALWVADRLVDGSGEAGEESDG